MTNKYEPIKINVSEVLQEVAHTKQELAKLQEMTNPEDYVMEFNSQALTMLNSVNQTTAKHNVILINMAQDIQKLCYQHQQQTQIIDKQQKIIQLLLRTVDRHTEILSQSIIDKEER